MVLYPLDTLKGSQGGYARKIRQIKKDLRKIGAYQVSQEGSHTKWKHPLVPSAILVLSGHDGDDAQPYQEKIVRDLLQQIARAQKKERMKYK